VKPLENQIAMVTGGGHGIGNVISNTLAESGAHVVLVGRQVQYLEELARAIKTDGGSASIAVGDVTDAAQIRRVVESTIVEYDKIDILVNNAGSLQCIGPVWDIEPAIWWHDVTVNLFGTFICCHEVMKHMVKRCTGKVINLGGGGALRPSPFISAYGSSKAALARLTETLHEEAKAYGVRVYAISPGMVDTSLTRHEAESIEGQKWLPNVGQKLREGLTVEAKLAAKLCVFLASPAGDGLGGRYIEATDDYQKMAANCLEVTQRDLYVLRYTRSSD
jgi:NAD(P)-dependent dehydrogenase (short-subunit alcohol dehydrogenase family)